MTYIPKNQLQTNLYSNGDFATIPDYKIYTGYYWKKSTGQKYTGRTPSDGINKRLIPLVPDQPQDIDVPTLPPRRSDEPNSYKYDQITNNRYRPLRKPATNFTKPISRDYQNGFFFRYFAKQRNQNTLFEISKDEYDLLNKNTKLINRELYRGIRIRWSISKKEREEIFLINKNIVKNLESSRNFYGLNAFFKDNYDEFYTDKLGVIYVNGKRNYTDYKIIPSNLPDAYQWGNKNEEQINPEVPSNQNCALCIFNQAGNEITPYSNEATYNKCTKWNAVIRKDYWCKSYQPVAAAGTLKDYTSVNNPNMDPNSPPSTMPSEQTSTSITPNTANQPNTGTSATITTTYSFGGGGGY